MSTYTPAHTTLGSGPRQVIALHGWLGDHHSWEPVQPHLDGSTFAYAFMDYRGYGDALHQAGDFTMDEIAADTLALADHLGWDTFSLIGHSMGGKAIQRVLARAPERVRALVGLNPVPASGVPFDDQGWELFSGAAENAGNRRAILDMTTGNRLTGTWLDSTVAHSLEHSTPVAVDAYLREWANSDFHKEVQGSQLPIKVIVGEHDPALNAEVMRQTWLQVYPDVELEEMPNAGHYPVDETPVALATSVERFLEG